MTNARTECTFLWFIENYSYCWHKNRKELRSPKFSPRGFADTSWVLQLYPRGNNHSNIGQIQLFLGRHEQDNGPEVFEVKFELAILAANGSALFSAKTKQSYKKGLGYRHVNNLQMNDFLRRKADYLPQDILTVRCKIWTGEGITQSATQINARTRIGIEKVSVLLKTENFSELLPNEKKTVRVESISNKGINFTTSLYFSDDSSCKGKVMVEITTSSTEHILAKCKLFMVDASGKLNLCCNADNRFDALRKDIKKLSLYLTRQVILNRRAKYLPNNKLTLFCECVFSTGTNYSRIESCVHELPFEVFMQVTDSSQKNSVYNKAKKLSACSSAMDDLKKIYTNQHLTDVEIKTVTKSFKAHKFVLCARSDVLNAMLSSDMKEKITASIQVDDLEDDTLLQFLVFLYTDHLENLEWESAMKLYYAGDKYAVEKLKILCASFLVENINTCNIADLLSLADVHKDSDLKKIAEDFILDHEDEVFGSDNWKNLIETNPQLVIRTMHLKYIRN